MLYVMDKCTCSRYSGYADSDVCVAGWSQRRVRPNQQWGGSAQALDGLQEALM